MAENETTETEPTLEELMARLKTEQQRQFVREYLVSLCAGDAAGKSGYSKKSRYQQGYQNLQNPDIKAAVACGLKERSESAHISRNWVIEQYKQLYRRAAAKKQFTAARQALDSLAKTLGMFSDELNVNLNTSSPAKVLMYFPDNGRGPAPEGVDND